MKITVVSILIIIAVSSFLTVKHVYTPAQKLSQIQELLDTSYSGDKGNIPIAERLLAELIADYPDYTPAYYQAARLVIFGGNFLDFNTHEHYRQNARDILEHAIKLEPDYPDIYSLYGDSYIYSKEYDLAQKSLDQAEVNGILNTWRRIINPWYYVTINWHYINRAELATRLQDYDTAKEYLTKVIHDEQWETEHERRAYVSSLVRMIKISYQEGDAKNILKLSNLVAENAHAKDAWARGGAAANLCAEGMFEEGLVLINKALSIKNYGVGRYNKALCLYGLWTDYFQAKEFGKAEYYFMQAFAINPNLRRYQNDFETMGDKLRSRAHLIRTRIESLSGPNSQQLFETYSKQAENYQASPDI